jgi:Icc-related predicted phosphoesterase
VSTTLRIAAAGDVHASELHRERIEQAFASLDGVDVVLLAGDLTAHGEPEEAEILARACRGVEAVVLAVLGNHDVHRDKGDELVRILGDAGVRVLDAESTSCSVNGVQVGIAGTKGFVGGFPGSSLPDFGEPLLRRVYAATSEEVAALERALQEIIDADLRIVLLHYSPVADTLEGEPPGIHAFLGSSRLGIPIAEYPPDMVLHGHAHMGRFEGRIGEVPVYNVAVHVTGRDFWIFELEVAARGRTAVEVE